MMLWLDRTVVTKYVTRPVKLIVWVVMITDFILFILTQKMFSTNAEFTQTKMR